MQFQDYNGEPLPLSPGKVVCVGRNYVDHIKELNNPLPDEPVLFLKPDTAIVDLRQGLKIPKDKGECHHELELAVLIADTLTNASQDAVLEGIWGYGLALDLTLRQVQSKLKQDSYPWERAKAFDGSCPVSPFIPKKNVNDVQNVDFWLRVNGEIRQQGNTKHMLFKVVELIQEISDNFTLKPGDLVLTGTPAGVGPLHSGDKLEMGWLNEYTCASYIR